MPLFSSYSVSTVCPEEVVSPDIIISIVVSIATTPVIKAEAVTHPFAIFCTSIKYMVAGVVKLIPKWTALDWV